MKHSLRWMGVASLGLGALCATPVSWAQQEGAEQAASGQVVEGQVVQVRRQDKVEQEKQDGQESRVSGAKTVELRDGKLILTDAEGNHQVIDVSGAEGLSIVQSETTSEKDGVVERKAIGKAIIVGPDGKKAEIEFGGDLPPGMEGMRSVFRFQPDEIMGNLMIVGEDGQLQGVDNNLIQADGMPLMGKYFIGVHCEPVNETLRSHLDLEEGTGLVVAEVSEDSPAEEAGIEIHDVLLFADESQLKEIADLSKVVNQVGEEEQALTLTLLRKGKEISVEVKPAERPANVMGFRVAPGGLPVPGFNLERLGNLDLPEGAAGQQLMELQRLGPGLLVDGERMEGVQAELRAAADAMREQMDAMREQMEESRRLMEEQREQMKKQIEELHRSREKARAGDKG